MEGLGALDPASVRPTVSGMEAPATSRHLAALETMLALERQLLETLLFKLTQAKLVLAANETRFVPPALKEVQDAMADIERAEADRVRATAAIAADWGLELASVTLAYLAEKAPEPYRERFSAHRYEFMDLTKQIEQLSGDNQRLAAANLDMIRGTLDILYNVTDADRGSAYDARGRSQGSERGPLRLDRSI